MSASRGANKINPKSAKTKENQKEKHVKQEIGLKNLTKFKYICMRNE